MRVALFLLLLTLPLTAWGQTQLERRREAKLAEPWLKQAPWVTDYEQARAQAREGDKVIFAFFTRSYSP